MKNLFLRILVIILGGFTAGLGFWSLTKPATVLISISSMLIALILMVGIVSIVSYFVGISNSRHTSISKLVVGCIDILISILFLKDFAIFTLSIPLILSIWVIIRGVIAFITAVDLRKVIGSNWIWLAFISVLMIIAGYFGFVDPIISTLGITYIVGFQIVLTGVQLICEGFFIQD